jgi:hypothetical protein
VLRLENYDRITCLSWQYYNFIRFGKEGLRRTYHNLFYIYKFLHRSIVETGEPRWGFPNPCAVRWLLLEQPMQACMASNPTQRCRDTPDYPHCLPPGHFEMLSTGDVPVLAFRLKPLEGGKQRYGCCWGLLPPAALALHAFSHAAVPRACLVSRLPDPSPRAAHHTPSPVSCLAYPCLKPCPPFDLLAATTTSMT